MRLDDHALQPPTPERLRADAPGLAPKAAQPARQLRPNTQLPAAAVHLADAIRFNLVGRVSCRIRCRFLGHGRFLSLLKPRTHVSVSSYLVRSRQRCKSLSRNQIHKPLTHPFYLAFPLQRQKYSSIHRIELNRLYRTDAERQIWLDRNLSNQTEINLARLKSEQKKNAEVEMKAGRKRALTVEY
jgi:hypothetical protein